MNVSVAFKILSIVLIAVAFYFLFYRNDRETVFIIAVLGAVAFFLSIRFEIRERQKEQN
ncbi:MAG: hypothetical protein N2Z23_01500 [Pyrinomonadaceae bacterium]|nr:hypothetical protein [Pyrinomonadaceae bacterium]MDW8303674.1 hypothetical protein [Acidobacteriota bacterium]